jgi:NADP-dependent 3-hydroxy acid dehydrogenase YdfG
MDIAIVTGAGSGLGLAISRKLIDLGLRVYGLGGNYSETHFDHEFFVPVPCNLADMTAVRERVEEILDREGNVFVLVNNAKLYPQKDLDDSTPEELEVVLKVNLLCPMVITRVALPSLVRLGGFIINIVANSPENARGGAIGAATAGGLRWMGEALFEQMREHGVKVSSVFPMANKWRPVDSEPPPRQNPQSAIDLDAVAEAVGSIVLARNHNVVTDLVIRPQRLARSRCRRRSTSPTPSPSHCPAPHRARPRAGCRSRKRAKRYAATRPPWHASAASRSRRVAPSSMTRRTKRRNWIARPCCSARRVTASAAATRNCASRTATAAKRALWRVPRRTKRTWSPSLTETWISRPTRTRMTLTTRAMTRKTPPSVLWRAAPSAPVARMRRATATTMARAGASAAVAAVADVAVAAKTASAPRRPAGPGAAP